MQSSSRAALALVVVALSSLFLVLTSCQSNNDTYPVQVVEGPELDVALSTDLAIPKDIDSIRIERLLDNGYTRSISIEEHELGPTDLELPALLLFSGLVQPDLDRSVELRVVAWKGVTPVVFADALFTMPSEGKVVVALTLDARCEGQLKVLADSSVASNCPDLQTCRAGNCASIDRRSEAIQAGGGTAGAPSDAPAGSAGDSNP